jgi:GDP-4-dehydro-6-deoxy-D-mannose reductase
MITGAAGMMGSHLAEALVWAGETVLPTYFEPTIDMSTVDPAVAFIPLDVCDRRSVADLIAARRPRTIYHLAAQSLPTVSWEDPWRTVRVNIEGTINILEGVLAVRRAEADYDPMVVIACSSAEYGASMTPERSPITEDAPLLPLHPYGVSKVGQDLLGFQYFSNFGIRTIRARIFNCTGPRKRNDVVSDFAKAAARALETGEPMPHGNLETARGFIDVRDMVEALRRLAAQGAPGEAYNICADRSYRVREVLEFVFEAAGQPLPLRPEPRLMRPSDEAIIFGDTNKLRRDTGWAPRIDIRTTIADVLAFERDAYRRQASRGTGE